MIANSALAALAAFLAVSPAFAYPGPLRLTNDDAAHGAMIQHEGHSMDLTELRLVSFSDDEAPVWITELEKVKAKAAGRKFMDISETADLGMSSLLSPGAAVRYEYPSPSKSSKTSKFIKSLYPKLSISTMKSNLVKLSSFRNRYYRSETGKQSQKWLLSKIHEYAEAHHAVTVKEFENSWGQNSIIASFPSASSMAGDLKAKDEPIVIVGSHLDSTNLWPFLPAPGADDDGSGSTSNLDAFRVLAAANFTPTASPVEFHWYSAEEGGLLGSQAIAKSYEGKKKVKAMIQFDMTAWVKQGTVESVGIIQDFVDPALTKYITELVETYLSIPPVATKCGYACSDHASWSKAGYQSAFSIESTFEDSNHNIHGTGDTIDHPEFSFEHMQEFSKLAVAFAAELGGQ